MYLIVKNTNCIIFYLRKNGYFSTMTFRHELVARDLTDAREKVNCELEKWMIEWIADDPLKKYCTNVFVKKYRFRNFACFFINRGKKGILVQLFPPSSKDSFITVALLMHLFFHQRYFEIIQ